jgi:hypothetical protein
MKRFLTLASMVVLGLSSTACSEGANNEIAPSATALAASTDSQPTYSLMAAGGNGGGRGHSSLPTIPEMALVIVDDANADNNPSWGDTIRITITNPPPSPNVEVVCSQGGVVVYAAQTGYYASTWPSTADMILSSRAWTGGSASCTARLYVFSGAKVDDLATMDFTATAE